MGIWAAHGGCRTTLLIPASLAYGAFGPDLFLTTLTLGCLCTDRCLGCSSVVVVYVGPPGASKDTFSNYLWHGLDRQGLPKTVFSNHLVCPLVCAPALQSHCKADPCGASLGAVWACLGVWLPYETMAKKTHVEALWWFFGPAWVRGPSCYSHGKADPCGASLRPLWACPRVWACLCATMGSQAHVELLWWLCWPATQTTRKQMSRPDTHQYTNTQGPV